MLKHLILSLVATTSLLATSRAGAVTHREAYPDVPVASRTVVIDSVIEEGNLKPLAKALQAAWKSDPSKPLDVVIDSPGGSVFTGQEFISTIDDLVSQGAEVRCWVPTLAASMAFQIYLHCTQRVALEHSFLLFHRCRTQFMGVITAPAARSMATDLQLIDDQIEKELKEYMPMDSDQFRYHFEAETLHFAYGLSHLTSSDFMEVRGSVPGLMALLRDSKGANLTRSSAYLPKKGPGLGDIQYIAPMFEYLIFPRYTPVK